MVKNSGSVLALVASLLFNVNSTTTFDHNILLFFQAARTLQILTTKNSGRQLEVSQPWLYPRMKFVDNKRAIILWAHILHIMKLLHELRYCQIWFVHTFLSLVQCGIKLLWRWLCQDRKKGALVTQQQQWNYICLRAFINVWMCSSTLRRMKKVHKMTMNKIFMSMPSYCILRKAKTLPIFTTVKTCKQWKCRILDITFFFWKWNFASNYKLFNFIRRKNYRSLVT